MSIIAYRPEETLVIFQFSREPLISLLEIRLCCSEGSLILHQRVEVSGIRNEFISRAISVEIFTFIYIYIYMRKYVHKL